MDNTGQLKAAALSHWYKNLRMLKRLDWRWWKRLSVMAKKNYIFKEKENFPFIYGHDCPYCKCFDFNCLRCPLWGFRDTDNNDDYINMCCEEWIEAKDSYLEEPTTKKRAIKAFQAMIKYIKENG